MARWKNKRRRRRRNQGEMMKYLKMLGLAGLMATALMAFVGAGTAMATGGVLCSTATNPCTSPWATPQTLDFTLKTGGSAKLQETAPPGGEGEILDTCTGSTVKGSLTSNPAGGPATGSNTEINWTGCTFTTKTTKLGKLRVTSDGDGNGFLIADEEIKVTILIFGFIDCEYGIKDGTTLGTLDEGKPATFPTN